MMIIILFIVLSSFTSCLMSLYTIYRAPWNIWSVIPLITTVWVIVPAFTYLWIDESAFTYGLQYIDWVSYTFNDMVTGICFICAGNFVYALGLIGSKAPSLSSLTWGYKYRFKLFPAIILMTIWVVNFLYLIKFSWTGFFTLILPVSYLEESKFPNYIVRSIHIYLPIGLATIFTLSKRTKLLHWILGLILVIITIGTGQRRNLITLISYWTLLYWTKSFLGKSSPSPAKSDDLSPTSIFRLMGVAGLLIVPLWWLRVYFTKLWEGVEVDPFVNRSPFDVLFGSGASGYSTHLMVMEYVKREGIVFGHSLYYGFSQVIPRVLWLEKPVGSDTIIQDYFAFPASPSLLWLSDLMLSFGWGSTPIAFILPIVLSAIGCWLVRKGGVWMLTYLWMMANIITLYKNGLGTFISITLSFMLTALLAFWLCTNKNKLHSE